MLSWDDRMVLSSGIVLFAIALMQALLYAQEGSRLLDSFQERLLRTVFLGMCIFSMACSAILLERSSCPELKEFEGFPKSFFSLTPPPSELCGRSRRFWMGMKFALIFSSAFLAQSIVAFLHRLALYPGRWVFGCGLGIFGGLYVGAYAEVTVWDEFLIVLPVTFAIVRIVMTWVEHVQDRCTLKEQALLSSLSLNREKPSWTVDRGLLSRHNCDNYWNCENFGSSRTEQLSRDIFRECPYSRDRTDPLANLELMRNIDRLGAMLLEKFGSYDSDIDDEDRVEAIKYIISRTTTYPESETDFSHSNGDKTVNWKANLYSTLVENFPPRPGTGHLSKQLDEDQKTCLDGKKLQDTVAGDVPILDTC